MPIWDPRPILIWLELEFVLQPTVSQSVCLGIKLPFGAHDQIKSQSQSHIMTDNQSANPSWFQAPIWDPRPIFLSPWDFLLDNYCFWSVYPLYKSWTDQQKATVLNVAIRLGNLITLYWRNTPAQPHHSYPLWPQTQWLASVPTTVTEGIFPYCHSVASYQCTA
jgi:hypothetical protein